MWEKKDAMPLVSRNTATPTPARYDERGNLLIYVLLGIVLLGALTIAIRNTGGGADNIDREAMIIKFNQIQNHAAEFANGVKDVMASGLSEVDIRFAHPDAPIDYGTITTDPTHQVFGKSGGKATYRTPPEGINDGSPWEFYATSAIPYVGSDRADLIAVLPNVTEGFCQVVTSRLGFDAGTQPTDNASGASPDCVQGTSSDRFTGTFQDVGANSLDETSFSQLPALQACVLCDSDSSYHYYYVLMAR